ncbi:MAG: DNA-processing protein DprA [Breznakibacter sp.]|nr:DNA-processing protein DprA [Breznakibacter sp.]
MNELEYQIGLTLINGIGPVLARNLVAYVGSARELFEASSSVLIKIPGIGNSLVDAIKSAKVLELAKRECDFMAKNGIVPIYFTSTNYPRKLSYCDDAPLMIYVKGNMDLNTGKFLSIVGTRNVTFEGKSNCEKIITTLASKYPELVIVSGLAYGVDVVAHKTAVQCGVKTIACLGHGLDRVYPYLHGGIAKDIVNNGALLTEYVSNTQPDKFNFVKRNRIIAGLSEGVLVVESGEKGGSLISAKLAADYNREVMAIPGRPSDLMSRGCNDLIKANIAALVHDEADVEFQLGWESKEQKRVPQQLNLFSNLQTDDERMVYSVLEQHKELDVNQLAILSNLPIYKVTPMLLSFEFDGIVKTLPGNCVKFVGQR